MKKIILKDIQELVQVKKEFLNKNTAEQEQHQCIWEQVSASKHPGFGIFNDRVFNVCFVCGSMK